MKATVVGGAGFIGRRLCQVLTERGYSVTVLDQNPIGTELTRLGVTPIISDVLEENAVRLACTGADAVFNLAGALGKWGTTADELEVANVMAAGFLVTCAAMAGVGKVVHTSTTGVTGPLPEGVVADEDYPANPTTDYQRTKLAGERTVLDIHGDTGVSLAIVRPGFVYGPGDRHKLSLFKAVSKRRMILVNNGASRLHPTYVDDLADGLVQAFEKSPGEGEIYNIAGPRPVTTKEIVQTIAEEIGVPSPRFSLSDKMLLRTAAVAEAIGRLAGKEPPITRSKVKLLSETYACSIEKARRELSYEPKVDLQEGISLTTKWYREQGFIG